MTAPACGFLALLCVVSAGLRTGEAPAKASEKGSLKAYVLKVQGRQAYGVYAQNQKIGWMISEGKLARLDGKEVALESEEGRMEITRGEDALVMEVRSATYLGLHGEGEVLR